MINNTRIRSLLKASFPKKSWHHHDDVINSYNLTHTHTLTRYKNAIYHPIRLCHFQNERSFCEALQKSRRTRPRGRLHASSRVYGFQRRKRCRHHSRRIFFRSASAAGAKGQRDFLVSVSLLYRLHF